MRSFFTNYLKNGKNNLPRTYYSLIAVLHRLHDERYIIQCLYLMKKNTICKSLSRFFIINIIFIVRELKFIRIFLQAIGSRNGLGNQILLCYDIIFQIMCFFKKILFIHEYLFDSFKLRHFTILLRFFFNLQSTSKNLFFLSFRFVLFLVKTSCTSNDM